MRAEDAVLSTASMMTKTASGICRAGLASSVRVRTARQIDQAASGSAGSANQGSAFR